MILSIGPNFSFTDTYTKSVITTIEPRPFGAEAEFENRLRQQSTQLHHHQISGQSPHNSPHSHAATSAIEKLFKTEVLNGGVGSNSGIRNGGDIVVVSCGDQVRMQSVITSCQSVQKTNGSGKVVGDSRTAVNRSVEHADTILPTLHSSIESYLSSQETLTSTESSFNSTGNSFHHLLEFYYYLFKFKIIIYFLHLPFASYF